MACDRLPLVHLGALRELEAALDGEGGLCRDFVRRYIHMWTARFARLSLTVAAGDAEAAEEAALSLRSSSHMVGALCLERYCERLLEMVREGSTGPARQLLPAVGRCGEATVWALQHDYVDAGAATG